MWFMQTDKKWKQTDTRLKQKLRREIDVELMLFLQSKMLV